MNPTFRLSTLLQIFVGAFFIYAAYSKVLDPATFAKSINNYHILPDQWVNGFAIFLPWLEILCGLVLIFVRPLRGAATLLTVLMLLVFIAAFAIALSKGLDILCGCTSSDPNSSKVGLRGIYENTGLIVALVIAWVLQLKSDQDEDPSLVG
jgi:uncharacterized membrane protein YphA (DoxX/SURF4 family)